MRDVQGGRGNAGPDRSLAHRAGGPVAGSIQGERGTPLDKSARGVRTACQVKGVGPVGWRGGQTATLRDVNRVRT